MFYPRVCTWYDTTPCTPGITMETTITSVMTLTEPCFLGFKSSGQYLSFTLPLNLKFMTSILNVKWSIFCDNHNIQVSRNLKEDNFIYQATVFSLCRSIVITFQQLFLLFFSSNFNPTRLQFVWPVLERREDTRHWGSETFLWGSDRQILPGQATLVKSSSPADIVSAAWLLTGSIYH